MSTDFVSLRCKEFSRLDEGGHTYLDYTGSALHAASQVQAQQRRLMHDVLGNPHSENPAALESTERMQRMRRRILTFFHADAAEYEVVITANASGALRLVGESFPFVRASRLVLTADNHNSVNGIRCHAERVSANVRYIPLDASLRSADPEPWLDRAPAQVPHLFAFPAQSNFSGARHPLAWVERARALGYHVLLDAAALVPTCALDLSAVRPDFMCISFYKMFGLPTGIGALVARRAALALLRRPSFAGGTVDWVSTQNGAHALRASPEAFEDGTPHFLAFDGVCDGLDLLDQIGMPRIEAHTRSMTARLLSSLAALHHPNGSPIVRLYGPTDLEARGGTIAFNIVDASGVVVPFDQVVSAAATHRISLRGGCFCNPGCAEAALEFPAERASVCRQRLRDRFTIAGFGACIGGPVGAVRASVGVPTVPSDIDRLIEWLEHYRGLRAAA
jgi:selenocysteine lyase/cysteine desulfurase